MENMGRILFNDNWMIKRLGDNHEFSLQWQNVIVPHDAAIGTSRKSEMLNGTKKAFFENGVWEYIKTFNAPIEWQDKDVFIEFQGVQNNAIVYINGNYVGKRAYGYAEFAFNISKHLNFGLINVIKIVCRTCDDSRWYTGAGIYRDVNLIITNKIHIENNGVKITTKSADRNAADLRVDVEISKKCAVDLKVDIYFEDRAVFTKTQIVNKRGTLNIRIADPFLWDMDNPNLYKCIATLIRDGEVIDSTAVAFGIRTVSVNAKSGLLINGRQVKLRGACIHHDNGVIGVRTFKSIEYRRIRKLKEAGFNAIRMAHHPASRYILQACDEMGMFIMDEAFDTWQIPKSGDDYANVFDENWKQDIKSMVDKDYNHPSVIMYSIGNEISDLATDTGVQLASAISAEVKNLDNTRFTTVAINGLLLLMQKMELATQLKGEVETQPKKDINEAMSSLDDVMFKINNTQSMDNTILGGCSAVDIAGYNYMHNRYMEDISKYPDRVIVGSETYAKYIADMWLHIQNHNNVIGDFTWTGWDYLGETGIGSVSYESRDYHKGFYGVYPCITANCGDIDITGFRLPQSYYREIVFGLRKQPYIAVHNPEKYGMTEYLSTWGWGDVVSSWSFKGFENKPIVVDVYSLGEAELFINGRSVGKSACDSNYKCSFTVQYEQGSIEAVTHVGDETYSYILNSANDEYELNVSCENDIYTDSELAFVNISLTDKNGVVHYGNDRTVTLEVVGGELLGYGSGAPQTEERYTDNIHSTYNGRAFAVILITDNENTYVTAKSGSLTSEKIKISNGKDIKND